MLDPGPELTEAVKGLRCTEVECYAERSWTFVFGNGFRLNVQCPWRIVTEHGIALGGDDDGQQFGRPKSVNGAARAMDLFFGTTLHEVLIVETTGDITLVFESGARLEVFNSSSGYEGWNCNTSAGRQVIGMGGGTTAHVLPS